jgi:salicylate hydroxylase
MSEIGAGLNLSPNALKVLRALGVEDEAIAIGCQPDDQIIRSWRSGRVIARQKRGGNIVDRFGAIFIAIHRADLLAILGNALPEGSIRRGARCVSVETAVDGAVARFADGSEIEADIVIGADGIHSAVRESLFGKIEPAFTGCICWRGLVPADAVPHADYSRDMTAWWGPHGHIVHYPVRRGELINFVAHLDSDGWTEESWTHECDRGELMETYARWNASLRQLIESSERYYKWALYDREPLDHWGRDRITLLGDSVHPMLPYLGQGACMAMEDGYILAESVTRSPDRLTDALRDYERIRMPRTRRAQLGSRRRARENHLASPVARLKRDLRMAWRSRFGKDKSPTQAEWLYEYDVSEETDFSVKNGG